MHDDAGKSLAVASLRGRCVPDGRGVRPRSPQRRDYPDRPPGDPAAIERGKALYGVNCQFCHGADTRGGDGGPSLLRSRLVLDDQNGELIGAGRPRRPARACRSSR